MTWAKFATRPQAEEALRFYDCGGWVVWRIEEHPGDPHPFWLVREELTVGSMTRRSRVSWSA